MRILAIDPGSEQSAYTLTDGNHKPVHHGKIDNIYMFDVICNAAADLVAIEMIKSYGMAVGAEVFDTCVWIGRFQHQGWMIDGRLPELITRDVVKHHHCHASGAKDSNVTRALVDRFTPGQSNYGKGTKDDPGWFHGFVKDIWQSYALNVYVRDREEGPGF